MCPIRPTVAAIALSALALLSACAEPADVSAPGPDTSSAPAPESPPSSDATSEDAAPPAATPEESEDLTPVPQLSAIPGGGAVGDAVTGTLGGDASLEGGCAWIDTDRGRFEVIYPEGYQLSVEPLQVTGPDGEIIAEGGDQLTVEGSLAEDIVSTCQVGRIWRATAVTPV